MKISLGVNPPPPPQASTSNNASSLSFLVFLFSVWYVETLPKACRMELNKTTAKKGGLFYFNLFIATQTRGVFLISFKRADLGGGGVH
jgi:hypothetical protein